MNSYKTAGVCSKQVSFDIVDNKISSVNFVGGCNGNLKGISSLIEGMEVNEAIKRLKGITCGNRDTSCPDQLSRALEEYVASSI
ncbi:TIGR03905 family TSCPD domain-containing protein [Clostridium manihotivorum]|uniref:ribonucleoside-diphosphate reductase n=1 Tax=Clostridium manihotivorum TaxID=2320868 RepID=A0A410DSA2_9CLOT|nr:TIGR03905 family TSCPD domain-containing protein [Clostridium manihotivorum]QAA31956.1 TIGR03905 family protein [Clostridium manihotivorum]